MSDDQPTTDDFELIAERCQGVAYSVSADRRDPIDAIDALSDVVFDLARLTARFIPQHRLEAENARLKALVGDLREVVTDLLSDSTNSYCEWCQRHAPKDDDGNITGPLPHVYDCVRLKADAALSRADAEAKR